MAIKLIDLTDDKVPELDRTYELPDKDSVVLGRMLSCDFVINDSGVSRRHCGINKFENRYSVRDLGSSNGTFVEGVRIEEANLEDGYRLSLGPHRFRVKID